MSRRSSPAFSVGGVMWLDAQGGPSQIVPPFGGWACFHCGERFYTFEAGVRHFGWPHQQRKPKCIRL